MKARPKPATKLALLHGRYRFEGELGRGAAGRVVAARDEETGESVALKVADGALASRLAFEASALRKVSHSNVARLIELLRTEEAVGEPFRLRAGTTVLVEARAEGTPSDVRARDLRGDLAALTRFVTKAGRDVARGLVAIHSAGLVHGDVKPANVVASEEGAVLVDFGFSCAASSDLRAGATLNFLAPEGFLGERTSATDAFALGATLGEWLRGPTANLVAAPSPFETLRRVHAPLPRALDPALASIVSGLTEERAEARMSVREAAAQLGALVDRKAADRTNIGLADGPSPSERARAVLHMPRVGARAEVDALIRCFERGAAVVYVAGPSGAGRSRVVREAVLEFQARRVGEKKPVPTYFSRIAEPRSDAIVHVRADALPRSDAAARARSAALLGHAVTFVLEGDAEAARGDVVVRVGPLDEEAFAELAKALGVDAAVCAAMRKATAGLIGLACRHAAELLARGEDPSDPKSWSRAVSGAEAGAVSKDERAVLEAVAWSWAGATRGALEKACAGEIETHVGALCARGLTTFSDDGRLSARPDVAQRVRSETPEARRRALAQALRNFAKTPAEMAFVAIASGSDEARYVEEAMSDARARGEPEEAAWIAEQAAALGVAGEAITLARADAQRAAGRYDDARITLRDANTTHAWIARAEIARLQGRSADANADLQKASRKTEDADQARIAASQARLAFDTGDLQRAAEHAARARSCAGQDTAAQARALEVDALLGLSDGDTDRAHQAATEALAIAETIRAPQGRGAKARCLSLLATVSSARGALRPASDLLRDAIAEASAAGERHAVANFSLNLGLLCLDLGDLGPARDALRDATRTLARVGAERDLARAVVNTANLALLLGDAGFASSLAAHALEMTSHVSDPSARAYAWIVEADVALGRGRLEEARARLAQALTELPDDRPTERAVLSARAALAAWSSGDHDDAARAADHALAASENTSHVAARIDALLASARVASGDVSRLHLRAAHDLALRAGPFEAKLRVFLIGAEISQTAGDREGAEAFRADARALLDHVARDLDARSRHVLRAVPAYRRVLQGAASPTQAFESAPDLRDQKLRVFAKKITNERETRRLIALGMECAVDLVGAERGVFVARREDGTLQVRAAHGIAEEDAFRETFSHSIAHRVIDGGDALSTWDAQGDARLDGSESIHALALRSVLGVPICLEGQPRAALLVTDSLRTSAFDDRDLARLSDLADLLSLALTASERLRRANRSARKLAHTKTELARLVEAQGLELSSLRRARGDGFESLGILGKSDPIRRVMDLVTRAARSDAPVLVLGESGTGKELIARAIHTLSARRTKPFVSENCSAIPESLLESALLGHVRGAFTGAERARKGLFEMADQGTLFLDEIGEMSAAMQAKLLRVTQDGVVRAVGAERTQKVDARIVCATHRDLEEQVRKHTFREDLYYRLAVLVIRLPPLRERLEDIPVLVAHFLEKHAKNRPIRIDRRALSRLMNDDWPGNVRQLENEIQRALVLADDVIREEHLTITSAPTEAPDAASDLDLRAHEDALARRLIRRALDETEGNQTRAAERLGLSRFGLQKMIKRLGIEA